MSSRVAPHDDGQLGVGGVSSAPDVEVQAVFVDVVVGAGRGVRADVSIALASRVPFQGLAGWGAFQRLLPPVVAPKGMPFQWERFPAGFSLDAA